MSRLPVYVSEQDIEEMFTVADRDKDGKISYQEFLVSQTTNKMTKLSVDGQTNVNKQIDPNHR